ncbi:hypothetical protein HYFRA_00012548 [Hymenoscyphus fraxineus]|uniref:Uncharacterized protein n=1 Tax=Hymenoscyphus fraxineus TaxID=746836 RepID=A0A9N9L615_9HELO|nr:hypothetical protein HYFRA_00012548 [Hymenoscyphus fraxineus]
MPQIQLTKEYTDLVHNFFPVDHHVPSTEPARTDELEADTANGLQQLLRANMKHDKESQRISFGPANSSIHILVGIIWLGELKTSSTFLLLPATRATN